MNKLIKQSFLNVLATSAYIAVIAVLLQNGEKVFGELNKTTGPAAFLMLFVLSAAVTGSLVLGKPVLMYLGGQKSEAVRLFVYTLSWLAFAIVILFAVSLV